MPQNPDTRPETTPPEATHPETTHPETTHPETTHPEATHPETAHPEATHPGAIAPETIHPEVKHAETTRVERHVENTHLESLLRKSSLRSFLRWLAIVGALLWALAALMLVAARWIDPPTTAVHAERRLQAWIHHTAYHERYEFLPLRQISPDLQHAVIAAEDSRFYQHHGFDWHAMQIAAEDDMEGGRIRGGSTLTQQLVKNLFFGTGRSILRKGAEFTLVPVAELVLGKRRILELYLNVVEWGPGVYGAEAACRYHYRTSARNIGREESTRLAAILPLPLKRRPDRMNRYSGLIGERMRQLGW